MPSQVNEFYKGVDKDTDPGKLEPSRMRDARNIRLVNIEGQGFVITNIGGNEKAFSLTPGFIPMGSCEYNGVSYIFSYNVATLEGEIGTYPSPKRPCGTGGFDHVYKPLNNFTGATNPLLNPSAPRLDFRTTLFNFDCEHQIQMFVRIDYDNSVNIYLTDFKNPIRTINSGFDQSGNCNNRLYFNGSFPNAVELLQETCMHPIVDNISIIESGCHDAGNWFFFIRYNTTNFNPTSFLGESNAVQIFADSTGAGIVIDGDPGTTATNKAVTLNLSNIDTTYPYVEIAFIHYYDGTFETGMIDQLYPVNPASNTLQITVTGCEQRLDFTFEDIIRKKMSYDVVKSITQIENRLWGGNCKSRDIFHPDLLAFANAIIAKPNDSLTILDKPFVYGDNAPPYGQYKDYQRTYENTGYFRSEAYPFAVVFVFKSGRESEPLPVTGYDAWFDPFIAFPNTQGILRFPSAHSNVLQSPLQVVANQLKIMGVEFDITATVVTQWMVDNICGFYFTRGYRNKNLAYQGVAFQTYDAATITDHTASCTQGLGGTMTADLRTSNVIPMLTSDIPFMEQCNPIVGPTQNTVYSVTGNPVNRKVGIYSPDHYFKKALTDTSYSVYKIADVTYATTTLVGNYTHKTIEEVTLLTATAQQTEVVNAYNIKEWTVQANGTFVSMFNEPVNEFDPTGFYYWKYTGLLNVSSHTHKNRAFATTRYIGIDATGVSAPQIGNYDRSLINVYLKNPDPSAGYVLTDQYDVKNTKYYRISDFIDLSNYQAIVTGTVYYKGDCFLQRTYIKQLYNPDYYPITQQDSSGTYYTIGSVISIVSENEYNTAMRYGNATNTYYPETGLGYPNPFVVDNIVLESDLFNVGYNQVLSEYGIYGYDSAIPFRATEFPTRIIYSNQHTPNAFSDLYKVIDINAYKDYDFRMGPINDIIDFNSRLISIQQSGINFHYINDRAMLSEGASSGELLIGSGDVLAQKAQNITDNYGTQHQWSIVKTDNAVYGIDAQKRKIWRLSAQGFDLISDSKQYRQQLHEILDQDSDHSDIIHSLPDNPICQGGIVGSYDRKYNDIVWAFMFSQTEENPMENSSIRFNEWIDRFTDKYDNASPFYISLNTDFFSFNPNIFPSQQSVPLTNGDAWRENVDVDSAGNNIKTTFYGNLFNTSISWYVNQYADITKIFDNFIISSSPDNPLSISYSTIFQFATQNPFVQPAISRHLIPHYRENRWKGPIARTQVILNTTNNIYSVNSPMRGNWMKTTLEYSTNNPIFVKSVITDFRISYQ